MTRRVFLSIMTAAGVSLLAAMLLILGMLQSAYTQRYRQQLRDEAAYAAAGLETGGTAFLAALPAGSGRITLIGADGTVLYDSTGTQDMENHSGRQEVQQALACPHGDLGGLVYPDPSHQGFRLGIGLSHLQKPKNPPQGQQLRLAASAETRSPS